MSSSVSTGGSVSGGGGGKRPKDKENTLANAELELIDPNPDIYSLFAQYNVQFFNGRLGAVTVEWSKRMTLCAGLCYYQGKAGGCRIKLSEPLLSLRSRKDLVDTLLHEMIHAYIFIVNGFHRLDRDGHGSDFQDIMHRINAQAGTSITVYHTFHDEVEHHRKHWWRCDGPCKTRSPYFGFVKRAVNRAPGPNDTWWSAHKASCSGSFTKVKEPDPKPKKQLSKSESSGVKRKLEHTTNNTNPITNFLKKVNTGSGSAGGQQTSSGKPASTSVRPKSEEIVILESDDEDEDLKLAIALSLGGDEESKGATPPKDHKIVAKPRPVVTSTVTSATSSAPTPNQGQRQPSSTSTSASTTSASTPLMISESPPVHRGLFQRRTTTTPTTNPSGDPRFPGSGYVLGRG